MATYTIFAGINGAGKTSMERRYYESLDNLKEVLDICNEVNIYDNTNKFKRVAYICDGIIRWKRDMIPKWSNDILK